MSSENWYKVDNVAKVFLATHSRRDTRTLRVCCTLKEDVDPQLLGRALETTAKTRRLFQVRIRRGLFWHYIEEVDCRPEVVPEDVRPCPVLYGDKCKSILHYRVSYYHKRINLEVFHALTDGSGALEFLNILVLNYLKLKHPDKLDGIDMGKNGSEDEREEDSYERFHGNGDGKAVATAKKSYHIHGRKLSYDQLQFFEVSMPGKAVIAAAKELGVGVSGYLGAQLMLAIYRDMPFIKRKMPITISMPVNLRNYYPSETSRNFFNSISVSHTFHEEISVGELAKEFEAEMKRCLEPEEIRRKMDYYQKLEHQFFVRMVPLALKQPVVRVASKLEARKVSAVISNLGVMRLPEEMQQYVSNYSALCSHSELFIVVLSYGDRMTLGVTSGYRSTSVLKNFVRSFSKAGIDVTVSATEVV